MKFVKLWHKTGYPLPKISCLIENNSFDWEKAKNQSKTWSCEIQKNKVFCDEFFFQQKSYKVLAKLLSKLDSITR